jgi:formate-nitrite transporter family protein
LDQRSASKGSAGNVVGAVLFAYAIQRLGLPDSATQGVLADICRDLMANSPREMFSKAILSGWLIATMVWLILVAPEVKFWTILLFTYLIGVGGFPHVIVGCAEASYLVFSGLLSRSGFLGRFMLPTLAGNLVGGTLIFALVSHAQVKAE